MWTLTFIFLVIVALLCAIDSSNKKAREQRVRELDLSRYDNPAPQKLHVGNVEDELRRLKEQAEEVARRSGAEIVSLVEVRTDENGERYIECHFRTDNDTTDVDRLLTEEGKVFGDRIISNKVVRKEKPSVVIQNHVDIHVDQIDIQRTKVDVHDNDHVSVDDKKGQ